MRDRSGKRSISGLAALLLLGVFAVGILAVLLSGARAYQRLTERDRLAYDSRTCVQYVATKVRQAPAPGAVVLSDFGDGDAMIISEEIEGARYWTQVYCYDGWLMELFCVAGGEFSPEDGEKVLPASDLKVTQQGDLLMISVTDGNGEHLQLRFTLRGWEEMP